MTPKVIYDEVKDWRGSKRIMITLFVVLMGVIGLLRWCGN
jgi:hypothetical protein